MTLYEPIAVGLSAIAIIVSVLSRKDSKRSADASIRSAGASEASAQQSTRSADVAERTYQLQLRPFVAASFGVKRALKPSALAQPWREAPGIYLQSQGMGVAFDIHANLWTVVNAGAPGTPWEAQVPALRPGDREEVGAAPSTGRVEVCGRITCRDAEGNAYAFERPSVEAIWRQVEPKTEAASG